jgi:hypothetical protein
VTLAGEDIVCVGFADWDTELWTNQHHLMSRLARDNRVLFIESLGLRKPQIAGRDVQRILRRLRRGVQPPRTSPEGVHVLSPLVLPLHSRAAVRAINARLLPALVTRAARRLDFDRPVLWAYVPQAEALLEALDPSLVVYHCVDDIAAQPGVDAASFRAAEERFAARADLVLPSGCARSTTTCSSRPTSPTRPRSPPRSRTARSTPPSTRSRAPASSSPARSWRPSSTCR